MSLFKLREASRVAIPPPPFVLGMNGQPVPAPLSKPGPWMQVYRGKIPGGTHQARLDALKKKLDLFAQLKLPGWVAHGFTMEMTPENVLEYQALSAERGLLLGGRLGLDATDPSGKGERMGRVAALRLNGQRVVAFTLADEEGAFDGDSKAGHSEAISVAFYATAGADALMGDQPWPIPSVHGGFPWNSTTQRMKFRCPQYYCQDWKAQWGKGAYEKLFAWANREWASLEARWVAAGLPVQPRIPTIQGYGWDLDDLVTCLVSNPSSIMWNEWYPDDTTVTGLLARNALAARGFTGSQAVWDFQQDADLAPDGVTGRGTLAALGVTPYDSSNVVSRVLRRASQGLGGNPYQLAA